jgi:hypothetical protein
MSPGNAAALTVSAVLGVAWLAFLVVGTARGAIKRIAFRATLLAVAAGVIASGRFTGVFAQVGSGGRAVLLAVLLLLMVSYLYLVRFCSQCGRMHRNFKLASCERCGEPLPDHGLTTRARRQRR